ncbi:Serine dehydratase alpha chain [Caloramator mitchellensis]|uniref:UPF0597 protein ABG79_02025 n=1 Tax=Caloramator mitchellensis TaxID=908809 RepID=A0A0R3JRW1_CALMK|nr:L-serine ammonia-lyase, iron-sulfur-dependent, subunit alpha [Caloramator mitchellensis]KRQ86184.1 Serine dehydratase alpha chain [Caloramator mitchellensis]
MKGDYVCLLKREVIPALGCTEPVAVALCCAKAKDELKNIPEMVEVYVSKNIMKNGMGVGVPNTGMVGLDISAAIGSIIGNSSKGLNVLEDVTPDILEMAKGFIEDGKVKVSLKNTNEKLYIESILYFKNDYVKVIIKNRHNNFVYIKKNGQVLLNIEEDEIAPFVEDISLTVRDILDFALSVNIKDIEFLLEGVEMNRRISSEGLSKDYGLNVGKKMLENIKKGILSDDIHNYAMALTAAGADARMAGATLPVMSSAGSGNQGLTAILPVVAVAEKINSNNETLARALVISHLITYHIKSHLGRLSPVCGCGVAASTGASCAIAYLLGGGYVEICKVIKNMVADIAGIICDGAKPSCALKLSTAASAAVQSALLALSGVEVSKYDGIVEEDVEKTIMNLAKIGTLGMNTTDDVILNIMTNKC